MKLERPQNPAKKYRAVFSDGTHTEFGSAGMDDFTKTHDVEQRRRYLNRHRAHENWADGKSAGALSRYILWGDSTSVQVNLMNYKLRFPNL